jgi:hypothetical protein
MTVQTVKLGRERFVLLREKDYRQLMAKVRPAPKRRRLSAQDRGDIAEAKRRAHEPSVPLSAVRARLGRRADGVQVARSFQGSCSARPRAGHSPCPADDNGLEAIILSYDLSLRIPRPSPVNG